MDVVVDHFRPYKEALETGVVPDGAAGLILDRWQDDFHDLRHRFIDELSFAVPSNEALDAIAKLSPLVEIGAGNGYWSALLARRGADVIAVDHKSGENGHGQMVGTHHPVKWAPGYSGLSYGRVRSVFLCWPPYGRPFAYFAAMRLRRGHYLAYIGEGRGGCTADDDFHDYVDSHSFDLVETIAIPRWAGIYDRLKIYRKN